MRVKAGFGVELGSVNSNLEQHGCQDHLVRITRATVAETTAGSREPSNFHHFSVPVGSPSRSPSVIQYPVDHSNHLDEVLELLLWQSLRVSIGDHLLLCLPLLKYELFNLSS